MPQPTRPLGLRRPHGRLPPSFLRIEHEIVDDKIYARLKAPIMECRIFPGERILQDGLVRPAAETVPEPLAILEALRRKDPDASEAALCIHVRRSVEQLEREAAAEEAQRT